MTPGKTYYITDKKELKRLVKEKKIIVIKAYPKKQYWWEFWNIGKIEYWEVIACK